MLFIGRDPADALPGQIRVFEVLGLEAMLLVAVEPELPEDVTLGRCITVVGPGFDIFGDPYAGDVYPLPGVIERDCGIEHCLLRQGDSILSRNDTLVLYHTFMLKTIIFMLAKIAI